MSKPHLQHIGNLKIPSETNLEALFSKDKLTTKGSSTQDEWEIQ